jgi:ABC-type amino acid transport substrate-binding protein
MSGAVAFCLLYYFGRRVFWRKINLQANQLIMNRARLAFLSLLIFSFTISTAQTFTGATWSKTKSEGKGTIKFCYVETPRFVYRDGSGNLTGISVDVMHDFVEWVNKNRRVELKSEFVGDGANFQSMFEKVRSSSGGVFGLGNITITAERKKEVKFSPPFITNFAILVSNGNLNQLNAMEEISATFKGAHAYAAKGTTNETRMNSLRKQYYPELKLNYTTTSQETLEKIANDPLGVGYLDLAFYLEGIQSKKPIRRHPVGDKSAEQFGFIMPLNTDWQPLLEEFFASNGGYTSSERYRSILQKHLGEAGMKLLKASR